MSEDINTTEIKENVIYAYVNNDGQKVFTPNLDFAYIMANKYGTNLVSVIKD
jgi:hypothetical protein